MYTGGELALDSIPFSLEESRQLCRALGGGRVGVRKFRGQRPRRSPRPGLALTEAQMTTRVRVGALSVWAGPRGSGCTVCVDSSTRCFLVFVLRLGCPGSSSRKAGLSVTGWDDGQVGCRGIARWGPGTDAANTHSDRMPHHGVTAPVSAQDALHGSDLPQVLAGPSGNTWFEGWAILKNTNLHISDLTGDNQTC